MNTKQKIFLAVVIAVVVTAWFVSPTVGSMFTIIAVGITLPCLRELEGEAQ